MNPTQNDKTQNEALQVYIASVEKTLQEYKNDTLQVKEYTHYVADSNAKLEEICGEDSR